MSKNLKEIFEETIQKGHGFIVTVSGNAKDACKEVAELATTNEMLSESFHDLGVAVHEDYVSAPNSKVYAAFSSKLKEINLLISRKEELETTVNNRFGKNICINCGAKVNTNHAFCPYCGTSQEKEEEKDFICPKCGVENPDDHNFCGKCGTKLL